MAGTMEQRQWSRDNNLAFFRIGERRHYFKELKESPQNLLKNKKIYSKYIQIKLIKTKKIKIL